MKKQQKEKELSKSTTTTPETDKNQNCKSRMKWRNSEHNNYIKNRRLSISKGKYDEELKNNRNNRKPQEMSRLH